MLDQTLAAINTDSNTQTNVNSGPVTILTILYIRGTSETIAPPCKESYNNYLLLSRTKTNQRTDREQYTRSNAVTASGLLKLIKPAETLARD